MEDCIDAVSQTIDSSRRKDVSSGPRPGSLAFLHASGQLLSGNLTLHLRGIRGCILSELSSSLELSSVSTSYFKAS